MDQISSSSYTSSSSSSSTQDDHPTKVIKWAQPSYLNSLHSVRKPNQKPMIMKKFIAPLPPTPPKVYKVDSSDFKEAVRALTSSPEFQARPVRRLKDIAPPPLVLSTIPKPVVFLKTTPPPPPSEGGGTVSPLSAFAMSPDFCKFLNETLETTRFDSKSSPVMDCFGGLSPLGSTLSPVPRAYDPFSTSVMSPLGFGLSPSSLTWASSMCLSPTTLSIFNPSPIL